MVSFKKIKICKIDSIEYASYAMTYKADFLGVHVICDKDIGKRLGIVKHINAMTNNAVVVTKIKESEIIQKLIDSYHPFGIQFHYPISQTTLLKIRYKNQTIKIFCVVTDELLYVDLIKIIKLGDYIIYDSDFSGGTGKNSLYKHLSRIPQEYRNKILLAGGIKKNDIKYWIHKDIGGFDMQSYFRIENAILYNRVKSTIDFVHNENGEN